MDRPAKEKQAQDFVLREAAVEPSASDAAAASALVPAEPEISTLQAPVHLQTSASERTSQAMKEKPALNDRPQAPANQARRRSIGLMRHYAVVASCILLAGGMLVLSMIDLGSLVQTTAFIDKHMQIKRPEKPPLLPPGLKFMVPESVTDGLYEVTVANQGALYSQVPGACGFVDGQGKVIVPFKFTNLGQFYDGLTTARDSRDANKGLGFIDKTGKWVISPRYDSADHFYKGVAIVVEKRMACIINKTGKLLYQTENDIPMTPSTHESDVKRFKQNVRNPADTNLAQWMAYDTCALRRYLDVIIVRKAEEKLGLLDLAGKVLAPPEYEDIVPMALDGMAGSATSSPELVYKNSSFEEAAKNTTEAPLLKFRQKGRWGLMNARGEIVLPAKYDGILSHHKKHTVVELDGKCGVVDDVGNEIIKPQYSYLTRYDAIMAAKDGHDWLFIDSAGKIIKTPGTVSGVIHSSNGVWFCDGRGAVIVGKKVGYLDKRGSFAIAPQFNWGLSFRNGVAGVFEKHFWHYIDRSGKQVSPALTEIPAIGDTQATVTMPGPLYDFFKYQDVTSANSLVESMRNIALYDNDMPVRPTTGGAD